MRRAFTLIELMVVVAIIFLFVSMSTIAVAEIFRSSEQAQAVQTFKASLAKAQAIASSHGVTTALRIERSFKIDENGLMKKVNDKATWFDHQQIRIVTQGLRRSNLKGHLGFDQAPFGFVPEQFGFRKIVDENVIRLPKSHWLAPQEALTNFDDLNVQYQPSNVNAVAINPFETFYVAFSRTGELKNNTKWLYYLDETQRYKDKVPAVEHPTDVTQSVIIYDRLLFESSNDPLIALRQGVHQHISRKGDVP